MASITAFSGHVPKNYETYLGPIFFEPYALDLVERVREIDNLEQVLEIACGTGRGTKHLAAKLPANGTLVATDLNGDMLSIAKSMVDDNRIQWQVADAHDLSFEDNSFDLVVCQYGVMFFQDKVKAFQEINRVLRPGGRFLFNTWRELQYNALSRIATEVLEKAYPDDPPRFLEKGPYSFFDREVIQQVLEEAGLTDVQIEIVSKNGVAASVDDAVVGILEGTPNYVYITERSIPIDTIKKQLKGVLIDHFGTTNLQFPMQAFVVEAQKA